MFRLPVSGLQVTIRQPVGEDDLLLQESRLAHTDLALQLVARLVDAVDGSAVQWSALSITDLEVLLLLIRRMVVGDLIEADTYCQQGECGARLTLSFRITDYLSRCRSRRPRNLTSDGEGWFRFQTQAIKFRLPAAADLPALAAEQNPYRELTRRCIQPEKIPAELRRRVLGAMAAMAPIFSGEVQGNCPECHRPVSAYFDIPKYLLEELRALGTRVYEDVHLLALNYQWSEKSILMLPRNRRILYAELLQQHQAGVA